jgi:hypothetical protein
VVSDSGQLGGGGGEEKKREQFYAWAVARNFSAHSKSVADKFFSDIICYSFIF